MPRSGPSSNGSADAPAPNCGPRRPTARSRTWSAPFVVARRRGWSPARWSSWRSPPWAGSSRVATSAPTTRRSIRHRCPRCRCPSARRAPGACSPSPRRSPLGCRVRHGPARRSSCWGCDSPARCPALRPPTTSVLTRGARSRHHPKHCSTRCAPRGPGRRCSRLAHAARSSRTNRSRIGGIALAAPRTLRSRMMHWRSCPPEVCWRGRPTAGGGTTHRPTPGRRCRRPTRRWTLETPSREGRCSTPCRRRRSCWPLTTPAGPRTRCSTRSRGSGRGLVRWKVPP